MRKISKPLPDLKQIEVNGIVFDIQRADIDILEKAMNMMQDYKDLTDSEPERIVKAVKDCIAYIDEVLGDGATKQITQGRPFGLNYAVDLMKDICAAVVEEYNDKIADEYE